MSVFPNECTPIVDRERIARIDAFRGLALVVVLIDHVERVNQIIFLRNWTLGAIGYCDGAEVFVFISGYVFGLTQNRRLLEKGFLSAFARALRRSTSIYLVYLITAFVMLFFGCLFESMVPHLNSYTYLGERTPKQLFISLVSMSFHPMNLSILAFYVVALPFATVALSIARYSWSIVWAVVWGLYGVGVFWPEANFVTLIPAGKWFFNPFAWQLLFVIGIACSFPRSQVLRHKWLSVSMTSIAMLVVAVAFACHKIENVVQWFPVEWIIACEDTSWMGAKSGLGPIRLIHFLCLAWLVSQTHVSQHRFILAARDVLSLWGRHSLTLYALGCVLSLLSLVFFHLVGCSTSTLVLYHLNCFWLCTLVGYCLHWKQRSVPKIVRS